MKTVMIFLFSLSAFAGEAEHKAHEHGAAKMILAMEKSNEIEVDLDLAADSIFGFEHEAKTAKQKKIVKENLEKLKSSASKVLLLDEKLGCKAIKSEAKIEKEEHEEHEGDGEHSDVNTSYSFRCEKALNGSSFKVGIFDLYPKVKKVSVQVLQSSGQFEKNISNKNESIKIP